MRKHKDTLADERRDFMASYLKIGSMFLVTAAFVLLLGANVFLHGDNADATCIIENSTNTDETLCRNESVSDDKTSNYYNLVFQDEIPSCRMERWSDHLLAHHGEDVYITGIVSQTWDAYGELMVSSYGYLPDTLMILVLEDGSIVYTLSDASDNWGADIVVNAHEYRIDTPRIIFLEDGSYVYCLSDAPDTPDSWGGGIIYVFCVTTHSKVNIGLTNLYEEGY